jgi:acetoin utilization deacetylase AcuC-like enzyme
MPILYTDPVFREHDTGEHPESPRRLESIERRVVASGLGRRFSRVEQAPRASLAQLSRVHDPGYIALVEAFAAQGGGRLDADTVVGSRSYEAAARAAGAAVAAVDAVIAGPHRSAACLTRPPGHHALPARAMGFCLFNNVAVAARHAQQAHGLSRVLIVDWDVHHGNGTQDIFYRDGSVWFFSAHRYPFYPGTGSDDETGEGPGLGATFNLPLPLGVSRADYVRRFESMLFDASAGCRPELVLISAGFDAHADDPIGSLGLESEDFGALTRLVCAAAGAWCGGRIVSVLEGGYNVVALAESVEFHLESLLAEG